MTLTLTLDDDLSAELKSRASLRRLSAEQFAISLLTEAVEQSEAPTPWDVVLQIQSTPPGVSPLRPATANLADLLRDDSIHPPLDTKDWNHQWEKVEAEMKATTRANDIAEGRGG